MRRFIFSSSCTVYGDQEKSPIGEDFPQWPKNPYGWTKFTLERLLEAYDTAYGLKSICLRYFNAAGATQRCGEDHVPETHLIPNVLAAAADPQKEVRIFGNQYPTPDGTAIRRLHSRGGSGRRRPSQLPRLSFETCLPSHPPVTPAIVISPSCS